MNLLKKTTPWMTASIFAVASLFGQDSGNNSGYNSKACSDATKNKQEKCARSFEQGQDILKSQAMPSYTAPATTQVRGSWDFFVTGSFIYWQPTQDNMEYGLTNTLYAGNFSGPTTSTGLHGTFLEQSFKFQPGFKVGIGMNTEHDNWDLFAEYTWLRDETSSHSTAPTGGAIFPTRGISANSSGTLVANVFNSASQHWTCNLDFLNLEMGRGCYFGKALTVRPAFGVRGTLIRQKLNSTYTNTDITTNSAVPGISTIQDYVHSWSVGPRAAVYTNWLLGSRFRLYGNAAGDATFTQYDMKQNHQFILTSGGGAGQNTRIKTSEHDLGVLRSHIEMELGFGWGSYFDNDNWYLDMSAGYTWQVFFDQNMFREFGTTNVARGTYTNGNLYINGLTANLRLDF